MVVDAEGCHVDVDDIIALCRVKGTGLLQGGGERTTGVHLILIGMLALPMLYYRYKHTIT